MRVYGVYALPTVRLVDEKLNAVRLGAFGTADMVQRELDRRAAVRAQHRNERL